MAVPVTLPLSPGAGGPGTQRQPDRGTGAEDHRHRDNGNRGRVGSVELALHGLPGTVVLLQLLHPVPEQVYPFTAGGRAQHVR